MDAGARLIGKRLELVICSLFWRGQNPDLGVGAMRCLGKVLYLGKPQDRTFRKPSLTRRYALVQPALCAYGGPDERESLRMGD